MDSLTFSVGILTFETSVETSEYKWDAALDGETPHHPTGDARDLLTGLGQQQVVQVPVSHSQDVGDDAVTGWRERRRRSGGGGGADEGYTP